MIVEDNVVAFPAISASGRPWARIVSCNPLELGDPDLPPVFSGYPTADRARMGGVSRRVPPHPRRDVGDLRRVRPERGRAAAARTSSSSTSRRTSTSTSTRRRPTTPRSRPLAPTWHRLDSSRPRDGRRLGAAGGARRAATGKLVYLRLGILGSADVELMQRLVDLLAEAPHRVSWSRRARSTSCLRLADNMVGAEFLPQTSILPQVDLVITHGGQQHDDRVLPLRQADGRPAALLGSVRQRAAGPRARLRRAALRPTRAAATELRRGGRRAARGRGAARSGWQAIAARLQAESGHGQAADLIERLARERRPIA